MQINLPSYSMAYDDRGSGIPVLFVHGYPLNRRIWIPQLKGLSEHARILAMDMRGHGDSDPVSGEYDMDLLAGDLKDFLDSLGISQRVVLCGLSMGGYVTFAFARKYPDRLAGIILTATRATPDTEDGKFNRDKAAALAKKEGVSAIVRAMLPKLLAPGSYTDKPDLVKMLKEIMDKTSLDGVLGDLAAIKNRPDSVPTLSKISVPTLIIHGAEDQLIPVAEVELMAESIPNVQVVVIPGAGHLPNMEQPETFNHAIQGFLSGIKT
jgi:3-oxoadipate enol-lactonase